MARKRQISAQAACKRLEILYATRLARADKLSSRFLLTKTGPRLYWCPGKPCSELDRLAEVQQQEHVAWKAAQMEQLEQEKAQLLEQLTRRRWPEQRGQQGEREAAGHGEPDEEDAEEEEGDADMQHTAGAADQDADGAEEGRDGLEVEASGEQEQAADMEANGEEVLATAIDAQAI